MRAAFIAFFAATAAVLAWPAAADTGDPLPRLEDAVCPGVSGLEIDSAELLVGRIRQNARAIGRKWIPAPRT